MCDLCPIEFNSKRRKEESDRRTSKDKGEQFHVMDNKLLDKPNKTSKSNRRIQLKEKAKNNHKNNSSKNEQKHSDKFPIKGSQRKVFGNQELLTLKEYRTNQNKKNMNKMAKKYFARLQKNVTTEIKDDVKAENEEADKPISKQDSLNENKSDANSIFNEEEEDNIDKELKSITDEGNARDQPIKEWSFKYDNPFPEEQIELTEYDSDKDTKTFVNKNGRL